VIYYNGFKPNVQLSPDHPTKSYVYYKHIINLIIKIVTNQPSKATMVSFEDLPLEVLLSIAEVNKDAFVAIRLINRDIKCYTNEYMEKYKILFSREITHDNLKYQALPDGTKHGFHEKWSDNGNALLARGYYVEGKKHGCFERWSYNGKVLLFRGYYIEGKKHGLFERFDTYGNMMSRCNFQNGMKHGLCQDFTKNHTFSDNYENGEKHGPYEHDYGHLIERGSRKNGKDEGLCEAWYKNGLRSSRCIYKDGEVHGSAEIWFENGNLQLRIMYENGKENGLYEEWNDNGDLIKQRTYKDGKIL
jgi:antitoxin component YwqK of YwqJK toxin-antitoxin module